MLKTKFVFDESEFETQRDVYLRRSYAMAAIAANGVANAYLMTEDKSLDGLINIICSMCNSPIGYNDFKSFMDILLSAIAEKDSRFLPNWDESNSWPTYCRILNQTIVSVSYMEQDPMDERSTLNEGSALKRWFMELMADTKSILIELQHILLYPGVGKKPRNLNGEKIKKMTPNKAAKTILPMNDNIVSLVALNLIQHGLRDFDWVGAYAEALKVMWNVDQTTYKWAYQTLLQESILSAAHIPSKDRALAYADIQFIRYKELIVRKLENNWGCELMFDNNAIGFICHRIDTFVEDENQNVDDIINQAIVDYKTNHKVADGGEEKFKSIYRDLAEKLIREHYSGKNSTDDQSSAETPTITES